MRSVLVLAAMAPLCALAQTKTLTIIPATERSNGDPMPAEEIAEHVIECDSGDGYSEVLRIEMPELEAQRDFGAGEHACRAYTVDTEGRTGGYSDPVPFVIEAVPGIPTLEVS